MYEGTMGKRDSRSLTLRRICAHGCLTLLLLSACGAPARREAQPAVTAGPALTPERAATAIPPPTDRPVTPTDLPVPTAPPRPTEPPRPTFELPPTPAQPLAQALGQITGPALLYNGPASVPVLMLADIDSGQRLWLTAVISDKACDLTDQTDWDSQSGTWSADGRFLRIACAAHKSSSTNIHWEASYLLDRQTGALTPLTSSPPAGEPRRSPTSVFTWSPVGHQLLLHEIPVTSFDRWSVLDAATGARVALVDLPYLSYGAWSPDGKKVALASAHSGAGPAPAPTSMLYLIGAAGGTPHQIALPFSRSISCCVWSLDQHFVYLHAADISPHDHGRIMRVDTVTGAISKFGIGRVSAASPDGVHYLVRNFIETGTRGLNERKWQVISADGTPQGLSGTGDAHWLPDGRLLVSECDLTSDQHRGQYSTGWLAVFTMDGQKQTLVNHLDPCQAVFPSVDGALVALNDGDHITVLDMQGQVRTTIDGQLREEWTSPGQWAAGIHR
jgi:hypothetical protein